MYCALLPEGVEYRYLTTAKQFAHLVTLYASHIENSVDTQNTLVVENNAG